MCGFLIEFRKDKIFFNKEKFLLSAKHIAHRGPDDQGEVFKKNFSAKFYRLSIIDLKHSANQPMISRDKKFLILFNGEIYNYKELKKKYNLVTKTNSDTEVILSLFENLGTEMVKFLEGMFSIVIYDTIANECYFFRDRFGIKPLYYFKNTQKIVFSSEIKPLINYTNITINTKKVADFFIKQSMDNDDKTFFKNIYSIEPASFGKVTKNSFYVEKYWSFENRKNFSFEKEKKKINQLFSNSVKKHLVSDRKVGFFFSGGTDSLSILSKALEYIEKPNLFTYSFMSNNGDIYGEHEKAKLIANDLNLEIDVTCIKPQMIIDNLSDVISACESPITSIRQICDYLLFKRFKDLNIPVAIVGHGGDEMLGGYDYNFINFLFDKYKTNLNTIEFTSELINYIVSKKKFEIKVLKNYLITMTYQAGSNKDCSPFIDINNFSKDFLDSQLDESFFSINKDSKFNYLQNSQLLDIYNVSLPRNLKYCDRLSMINGIEARVPFLDHKLANHLFTLNNSYKFHDNETRWIFKKIFNEKISKYFEKKKNSVPDPQSVWLKNDLKEFFMDEFLSFSFKKNYFFNYKSIIKNLNDFHKGLLNSSFNLFQIFSFNKFLKRFNI
jgi:asparagine synthase (glutamine-hydrolysing)